MRRFAFGVQYLGTPYAGFARTHAPLVAGPHSATDEFSPFAVDDASAPRTKTECKPTVGVLDVVEHAFKTVCGEKGRFANLKASSRTDAGVHGLRNICHVDIDHPNLCKDPVVFRKGLNYFLNSRRSCVHITDITPVPDSFDARIDATARSYLYKILLPRIPPAVCNSSIDISGYKPYLSPHGTSIFHFWSLFHQRRAWVLDPLPSNIAFDPSLIHEAAQALIGEHDFASFRGSGCQSSTSVREIFSVQVFHNKRRITSKGHAEFSNPPNEQQGASPFKSLLRSSYPPGHTSNWTHDTTNEDFHSLFDLMEPSTEEVDIIITGDSFLQRMVRNIVGVLVDAGFGKVNKKQLETILSSKNRNMLKSTPAPAHGLYLLDVHYDRDRRVVKEQKLTERWNNK